jgi:hypothetical protein
MLPQEATNCRGSMSLCHRYEAGSIHWGNSKGGDGGAGYRKYSKADRNAERRLVEQILRGINSLGKIEAM